MSKTQDRAKFCSQMQLLSVSEVADILGITQRHVYRLIANGQIIAPIKIVRSFRFRRSDIELWISMDCPSRKKFEASKKGVKK